MEKLICVLEAWAAAYKPTYNNSTFLVELYKQVAFQQSYHLEISKLLKAWNLN